MSISSICNENFRTVDNPFLFFGNNLENSEEKLESLEDDNESDISEADKE